MTVEDTDMIDFVTGEPRSGYVVLATNSSRNRNSAGGL
jgi:hypothetical protein